VTDDIIAYVATSLDGYLAASDGTVSFLDDFGSDEYDFDGFFASVGCLAMGSTTYEQVLGFGWPYGDRPCLVLTTRDLAIPDDGDVTFDDGPTGEALRSFAARHDSRLWVVGGGTVITAGIEAGAIDTLELYVMPVALGDGIPLFSWAPGRSLQLRETTPFENGVVRLVYAVGD
jgi:dihydrofolate reductase